jgi:hypothetical protein
MPGYSSVNITHFPHAVFMDNSFPKPERPLDRAVRAKLDADFRTVDADRMLDNVRQRLAADAVAPSRRRRRLLLAASGALAASLLVGVFLLFSGGSIQASPRDLVERARSVHAKPIDRCYVVRVEIPPEVRKHFPRFDFDRESRLWTRGDRYFVELPNGHSFWGRDEAKRVWFVPTPDAAVQFDDDEVPAVLQEFLNIRAVNLADLLAEVLADCDLTWANNVDVANDVRRVYAVGRDPSRSLRGAVIDVDKDTNVVRRLAIDRQLFRDPRAKVSITFTLADTSPQELSQYTAAGHLKPGAPILDRSHKVARIGLLTRHLGPFKQD